MSKSVAEDLKTATTTLNASSSAEQPMDSLRRDDFRPAAPTAVKYVKSMRWMVLLGDGSRHASQTLFTEKQAKRFVRLAKRWNIDVYAVRFGKIKVKENK